MISNVSVAPTHPFAVGVTVIVPVVEVVPAFTPINEGIFPFPPAPKPIEVLEFVQSNVVPVVELIKFIGFVTELLHNVWSRIGSTLGDGSIVITKTSSVPTHPFVVGVTVIVPLIAELPEFVPVNEAIFPFPDEAKPIFAFELDHSNVVPAVGLVRLIAVVFVLLQIVSSATGSTVGDGLTVITKSTGVPTQVFDVGVTEIVPEIGIAPALVPLKAETGPFPFAPSPIPVLEFVQAYVVPA